MFQQTNSHILGVNFVLNADSYKLSHNPLYKSDIKGMMSYVEPRITGKIVVPFGAQMWVQKNLANPITVEMLDEAEAFASAHGEPFDREFWQHIVDVYAGYIPIVIKVAREGVPIPSANCIATVVCLDEKVRSIASFIETSFQRGLWYSTTIASEDLAIRKIIKKYFDLSVDAVDENANDLRQKYPGLPFMYHDFGARGVTCEEQAQIGGAAHLVNFTGSDTISGIRAANWYYDCAMAAFSVPATEHSVQCSYGSSEVEQREYIKAVLTKYLKKGAILSIVLDGYDIYRESATLCSPEFVKLIQESGARVVFRPDSGDPHEVIPRILAMQEKAFGYTVNSKGYKVINCVGVIQGDGVCKETIESILKLVTDLGYSAQNIVFGSGGALLQKINRDTYKFAQKVCAVLVEDENGKDVWKPIVKDPITDPGKKSKSGYLGLFKSRLTGEFMTFAYDPNDPSSIDSEWEDAMVEIYNCGEIKNRTTLEEVRNNVYKI